VRGIETDSRPPVGVSVQSIMLHNGTCFALLRVNESHPLFS